MDLLPNKIDKVSVPPFKDSRDKNKISTFYSELN